jgi:sugar phosphate isomerase/epimerase
VAFNLNANLTTASGVDRLLLACRAARSLEITTVVTAVEETASSEGATAFFRQVDRIVSGLEAAGVKLGVETHGGLATTGRSALALISQIGSASIGLTYDTANVVYWGGVAPDDDLEQILDALPEKLFHVHLKDKASWARGEYDFPIYGRGVLNLPRVLALIDAARYRGPISVEVELDGHPSSPEQVDRALRASVAYLLPMLAPPSSATSRVPP